MKTQSITKATDHFSLNKLAGIVEDYSTPSGAFDSEASWIHRYDIYSLAPHPMRKLGDLSIERVVGKDNGFSLKAVCRRDGYSGYSHYSRSVFECNDTPLSVPARWTIQSKLAESEQDKPYLMSGLKKSVTVEHDRLIVEAGKNRQKIQLRGAYTCAWCLFDAAQRLSASMRPVFFTLIDEGDAVAGKQSLRFHKAAVVRMRDREVAMRAFRREGEGVIPTVYWVDLSGRLLFVVTGLEVYVLAAENGEEI